MKRILFCILSFAGCLLIQDFAHAKNKPSYNVIINIKNPTSSLTRKAVSKLFLKKTRKWPDGKEVRPIDRLTKSAIREEFSKTIHNKSTSSIKAYWQRQIFSGHSVPGQEKRTDKEVIDYVRTHPGAIGYVSKKAKMDSVKVLKIKK